MPSGNFGPQQSVKAPARKLNKAEIKFFWRTFWPYLKTEKWSWLTILVCILFSIGLQLTGPLLVSNIINNLLIPGKLAGLLSMLIYLVLVYLASSFFSWYQDFLLAKTVPKIIYRLRTAAYQKLQYLPVGFYDQEPFGKIMSLLTNDLDNLDNALTSTTTQIISSVLSIIGALFFMFYQNFWLALATFITVPLTIILSKTIAVKAAKFFAQQQNSLATINGYAEETLNATILIKAYGKEKQTVTHFDKLVNQYYSDNFKANFFAGLIMMSVVLMNNLNLVILGVVGGSLAFAGLLQIGILASFLQYQQQFTRPLGTLANQFMTLQLAIISGERVMRLFTEKIETNPENSGEKIDLKKELQIKNLSFAYTTEKPILKKINFEAKTGQTVALVGPTGSGKTTLASLLLRFYDPTEGEILFDQKNVMEVKRQQVRDLIGVVLQDVHLFSGTIADNIRLSKLDATDKEVIAAAKKAHADEFIQLLENGYQTEIKANAVTLSQGQKQLLAIARAFLIDPPMLILDEATSNVDTLTELAIQKAMNKLLAGRLSLVIAHRLSTVKNADLILVMKNGEIIERGNHQELLRQNGFYAQIYHSQDADLLAE